MYAFPYEEPGSALFVFIGHVQVTDVIFAGHY